MRKAITLRKMAFALMLLGGSALTASAGTVNWDVEFTPTSSDTEWELPSGYVGTVKISTNYNQDLTENNEKTFFYSLVSGSFVNGQYPSSSELDTDGYVYYFTLEEGNYYAVVYDGNPSVTFTASQDGTVTSSVLGFDDSVTLSLSNMTCEFETGEESAVDMSIVTNSKSDISDELSFYMDLGGMEIPMTSAGSVVLADGCYAYNYSQVGTSIVTLKYVGLEDVEFTFVKGYQAEGGDGSGGGEAEGLTQGGEITLGAPFEAGPNAQEWTYEVEGSIDADFYLETSTADNLVEAGDLLFLNGVYNYLEGAEIVTNPETGYLTYTFHVNADDITLVLQYTGKDEVTLTLGQGQYSEDGAAEYMSQATNLTQQLNINSFAPAVELTWGETVYAVDLDQAITFSIDGEMQETRLYGVLQLISDEPGEPGDMDDEDEEGDDEVASGTILIINLAAATAEEILTGTGTYVFNLPEGVVKNADSEINPAQAVTVEVYKAAVGEFSPASGAVFATGVDVEFTISFESEAKINESEDAPVLLINGGDFAETLEWGEGVSINDEGQVVIKLGNELAEDTYTLYFRAESVTVGGMLNAELEVTFTVGEEEVQPSYMDIATNLTPQLNVSEPYVLQLTWSDLYVAIADQESEVEVYMGDELLGTLTVADMGLQSSATEGEPELGEGEGEVEDETVEYGNILNISFADLAIGMGTYTFKVPEGLVAEKWTGYINPAQTVEVEITPLAQGSVSPEAGAKFKQGEEVVITFSFQADEIVAVDSEDTGVMVYSTTVAEGAEPYDKVFTVEDSELTFNAAAGTLTLNLGSELEVGYYVVYLRQGTLLVDGTENMELESAFEVVEYSSGISSLEAEAAQGAVYNLQGVKVNPDNLKPGIYVVNGKKVLVK